MDNVILISHSSRWGLSEIKAKEMAVKALKTRGLEEGVELSIAFVGRKRAKELNVNYRKMSYIPQVLGFPMSREKDKDGWIRLGDIVICTQKLKDEAKLFQRDIYDILDEWMLHGVDNLLK
jgi:rRNA maturation RNase YbeY